MIAKHAFSVVTLVAVTLHVLLGCCWHHAHPCDSEVSAAASQSACHCHEHSASDNGSKTDSKDEGHPCEGIACTFCLPDAIDYDFATSMTIALLPPASSSVFANTLTSVDVNSCASLSQTSLSLPESLHALTQVWLI